MTDNQHSHNNTSSSHSKTKGQKLRDLFDDLSIAQVLAGALAAATVFLLSSTIGWAGSLIGVVVGSITSAVTSQIYKKVLSASADKIRDVTPDSLSFSSESKTEAFRETVNETSSTYAAAIQQGSVIHESVHDANADQATAQFGMPSALDSTKSAQDLLAATTVMPKAGEYGATQKMPAAPDNFATKTMPVSSSSAHHGKTEQLYSQDIDYVAQLRESTSQMSVDPALQRAHERRNRKARIEKRVLIVSVVSALLAIVVSSGIISLATAGEGIGEKPESFVPAITFTPQDTHDQANTNKQQATTNTDNSSSTTANDQQNQGQTNTDTNNQSSTDSSDQTGNESSNSGSSGSKPSNPDHSSSSGTQGGSESGGSSGTTGGSSSGSDSGGQSGSGSGSTSGGTSNTGSSAASHANVVHASPRTGSYML